MKTIKSTLTLLLFLATNMFSQETYPNGQVKSKGDKQNGEYIEYYEDGKTKSVSHYLNGVANGEFIDYDKMGNITFKRGFKDNEFDGEYVSYYKMIPGAVYNKATYKNGELIGEFLEYDTNGNLVSSAKDFADGREVKGYFKNGNTSYHGFYVNGVHEGVWEEFYENGKIKEKGLYKNDEKIGEWVYYNEDGSVKEKKNENIVIIGTYPNGKPITTMDTLTNEETSYYENGQVLSKGKYIIEYHFKEGHEEKDSKGNWVFIPVKKGVKKKSGEWLYYYPNGKLFVKQSILNFNGSMSPVDHIGTEIVYDSTGKVLGNWSSTYDSLKNKLIVNGTVYQIKYKHLRQNKNLFLSKGIYKDGNENGEFLTFEDDFGVIRSKSYFSNGMRTGVWITYYEDGKTIARKETMVNDKRNGEYVEFNKDGTVKIKKNYKDGVEVK